MAISPLRLDLGVGILKSMMDVVQDNIFQLLLLYLAFYECISAELDCCQPIFKKHRRDRIIVSRKGIHGMQDCTMFDKVRFSFSYLTERETTPEVNVR